MALLEPRRKRIAPPAPSEPDPTRVPDELAAGTPAGLAEELGVIVGEAAVLGRVSDLVRYAPDASPYRYIPRAVVQPRSNREVAEVMALGRRSNVPVVFRSGGTSLCGQSQTDGILADVRRHWSGIEVLDDGARVRVKPGTVLGQVNRVLAPYGRKLGPDPASTEAATIGGVVANNSGGMRCGTVRDSYATVTELTFVLPSGTVIDTGAPGAAGRFSAAEPELVAGLETIRDEVRGDLDLRARIERKFEIKNTMGYRLSAFLDADEPLEIFRLLLIGSEGTLAFVAEVVYETVPQLPLTSVAWIHFASIKEATDTVGKLVEAGASAVELMVAPALMVAANSIPGTPEYWKELPLESAALLVEFAATDPGELDSAEASAATILQEHEPIREHEFTREEETAELFWRVREGLHGLIGQLRPPGTSLIIEDVCVQPARIAEAAEDLRALLTEHGFLSGVAGHASAGNLHFMLTPDFSEAADVERYDAFMDDLVTLIIDTYDGSLKAEHGTGITMAPFVAREWGQEATGLMWRLKRLSDPDGVLGPGVLLNDSHDAHLANLRTLPPIEESATSCVECGMCEPVCPSRDLTFTPRQRIVLRREMVRQPEGSPVREALISEYGYGGLDTCAADGSCAHACPLNIDTGKLVKELRAAVNGDGAERAALRVAKRWRAVERSARRGLGVGEAVSDAVGDGPVRGVTALARRAVSAELVPEWEPPMPPPAPEGMPATNREGAAAVYLPACVNRIFGRTEDPATGEPRSLPAALVAVSERAGKPVWIPAEVAGTCCSTPWASKGYERGAAWMANATVEKLWFWSDSGALPAVIDASSCTHGLLDAAGLSDDNRARLGGMEILDSIEWAERELLSGLEVAHRLDTVVIHPTCSSKTLGLDGAMRRIAAALAEEVIVPPTATCCGFAGDRGFLRPELTAAATAAEAAEVRASGGDAHVCANRTCEIGLERATGERYESFVYLLESLTRPG